MRAPKVWYALCTAALCGSAALAGTNNLSLAWDTADWKGQRADDAPLAGTNNLSLAWDPSPDTNVVGYYVYWGNESTQYNEFAYAGHGTTFTVSNLADGLVYFFVVTAVDADGLESEPSNEISYSVPGAARLTFQRRSDDGVHLRFPGYHGRTVKLQASEDLVNWITIWFGNPAQDGWLDHIDPASGFQARFYRLLYPLRTP